MYEIGCYLRHSARALTLLSSQHHSSRLTSIHYWWTAITTWVAAICLMSMASRWLRHSMLINRHNDYRGIILSSRRQLDVHACWSCVASRCSCILVYSGSRRVVGGRGGSVHIMMLRLHCLRAVMAAGRRNFAQRSPQDVQFWRKNTQWHTKCQRLHNKHSTQCLVVSIAYWTIRRQTNSQLQTLQLVHFKQLMDWKI